MNNPIALAWYGLFFAPERPTPIALFRILYGVIVDLLLLRGDWFTWYGHFALTTPAVAHKLQSARPFDRLIPFPTDDSTVEAFYWFFLVAAICLTIGLLSRFSTVAVFLALLSLQHRNPTILNGADALIRIIAFLLIFAPTGAAMSIDRLLRVYLGRETSEVRSRMPWAQRMIQLQVSILYISTCWWKTTGTTWVNGTAVYYALHLAEFHHLPLPNIDNIWIIRLMTWGTLATEFSMGVLVWFKEFRYWALLAGLFLHLVIEYAMNIPLFQWIVLASYINFLSPDDLAAFMVRVRCVIARLIKGRFSKALTERSRQTVSAVSR